MSDTTTTTEWGVHITTGEGVCTVWRRSSREDAHRTADDYRELETHVVSRQVTTTPWVREEER